MNYRGIGSFKLSHFTTILFPHGLIWRNAKLNLNYYSINVVRFTASCLFEGDTFLLYTYLLTWFSSFTVNRSFIKDSLYNVFHQVHCEASENQSLCLLVQVQQQYFVHVSYKQISQTFFLSSCFYSLIFTGRLISASMSEPGNMG